MRRILLLALLYFTGQANAQSTRTCFIEEESGAAATGARVEVFENGLLLGMQDLGGLNCFDLGIIIALEAEEVPGAEIAL